MGNSSCIAPEAFNRKFGGAREDRTPDLLSARQALSQLSYGPKYNGSKPLSPLPREINLSCCETASANKADTCRAGQLAGKQVRRTCSTALGTSFLGRRRLTGVCTSQAWPKLSRPQAN